MKLVDLIDTVKKTEIFVDDISMGENEQMFFSFVRC